ncbi:2-dehydro-3-deoxygalactonokinase [Paracoccus sediminis]|uniref:2-dehydro-3-deoxygalactonokinase n=1 Tax=Paracoccus sediminis TaxID=1214787 RepID=A0A238X8E4_9RHOB|nr:2-dehydro-3-deoxygalactonokinase [Paracoccus sediminis]TBN48965.1 2-dehydro-3-deoxygalactonokinase [Paracoccus sediminis]SNR54892.1 2-keto-3-deoxygalactonate kinase [Paracoccus sediminis]
MTALIGIDWGTTSFRAWRMGPGGEVLDSVTDGPGILAAGALPGGFAQALQDRLGGWLDGAPIIASGMIASRNGWVETPYLPLPLDAGALANSLTLHDGIHFVTGAVSDPDGPSPDVMRGEETEIIGHLAGGGGDGLFVLPGTHSKWARTEGGTLVSFRTVMTGEVFGALRDHTILGRLIQAGPASPEPGRDDAFRRGVEAGRQDGALLGRIFSARTLALMDRLPLGHIADYLSGLLIGDEVAHGAQDAAGPVTIIGRGDLAARYQTAFAVLGRAADIAPPGMAQRGLWDIARLRGLA